MSVRLRFAYWRATRLDRLIGRLEGRPWWIDTYDGKIVRHVYDQEALDKLRAAKSA